MTVLFFRLPACSSFEPMPRFTIVIATLGLCVAGAGPATAQITGWANKQYTLERLDADTVKLVGQVEVEGERGSPNEGQKLAADEVLWNLRTGEFTASGNVLLANPTSRLSAERVVFNTRTQRGTFYTASGISQLGSRGQEDITMFGTLEPDVYFYGEVIEKIGEDKYRITRGGFTTCVQPTPRWEVVSTKSTINLNDYAILRNAVMRVKDVPVFYTPFLYLPIQDDNRATGFLMPTYGNSTLQGQSLSNAFFWAIDRSQDLTLLHDWYFSRGSGYGSEYRYVAGPASNGEVRFYRLSTDQATLDNGDPNPGRKAYEIRGSMSQQLPYGLRARGRVDYFSDITTQQLYNQNPFQQTLSQRLMNGSVSGAWGGVSLTGNYQRTEQFFSQTNSVLNGYTPSIQAALSSRRLGKLPLYFGMNGEAANVLYANRHDTGVEQPDGTTIVETDNSLGRVDFTPSLRAPLTNLPYLNLTTQLSYRYTYFTESLDLLAPGRPQVPVGLARNYAEMKAEVVGPVFSKVFNPNNRIAARLKHIVEPNFAIQRTTSIDDQDAVPQLGNIYDSLVGGVTRISYGITNRFMVRGATQTGATGAGALATDPSQTPTQAPTAPGSTPGRAGGGSPRELLTIGLIQSYYTDERASKLDQQYQSSFGFRESSFSPIALSARASITSLTSATMRMEYDQEAGRIQGLSAQGAVNYPNTQVSIGWSRRRLYEVCPTQAGAICVDQTLNAATTLKFAGGRTGGTYAMDWDIARSTILQQRWIGFYSAQCCGFTIEYQSINYPQNLGFLVPQNRRFNFGFTLAGVGTFSNFFGAFGGNSGAIR
jgi:hypothetical protein